MADRHTPATARRRIPAPAIVTPLTKVNLALPFSKITVKSRARSSPSSPP